MKEEVARKWIERLRNPNMRQARLRLKNGRGMCCLGHLAIVLGDTFNPDGTLKSCPSESKVLSEDLRIKAGMGSKCGVIVLLGDHTNLSVLNDNGKSLRDIADIIERHWREL